MKNYKLVRGGMQWRFHNSTTKIRLVGGGFGNGKTTALCIDALTVAKDYPGCNILLARSTYPKLNDTLRKECLAWCPNSWVKRKPTKDDNTLILKNGSVINFRYVAQQGKQSEDGSTTSNLLSATYDYIGLDQVEDPEIEYKDFTDLLGRLRGSAIYRGERSDMPATGPRFMVLTCNPTRNWVYRKIVRPYHEFVRTGKRHADLLVNPKTHEPIIELFEASTYENIHLDDDFVETLEATYKGQMRERFLMGGWGAFEGLVYPDYDSAVHEIRASAMKDFIIKSQQNGVRFNIIEGYDYGLSSPSCYMYGVVDQYSNIHILDGLYKAELHLATQTQEIERIRRYWANYLGYPENAIIADPAIFKRQSGSNQTSKEGVVGRTIADMFEEDYNIIMQRGNNNKLNGITKVTAHIALSPLHRNPYTQNWNAPFIYINEELEWFADEITEYYWKKDAFGEYTDQPIDRRDHAMDALKYMLSYRPIPAAFKPKRHAMQGIPMTWAEVQSTENPKAHRYG
jgi:hypothetical protein